MFVNRKFISAVITCLLAGAAGLGVLGACSKTSRSAIDARLDPTLTPVTQGQSRLDFSLVDAPEPLAKEIWVTIDKVVAHSETAGWVTVASDVGSVDLLTLQSNAKKLGFADLPPGKVTQVRLYLDAAGDQHIVLKDGTTAALKVPSGVQSGIKIKGLIETKACELTSVTIDFNGHKSLFAHPTGQGTEWILRPVIRVKEVVDSAASCNQADAGTDAGTDPAPAPAPAPVLGSANEACVENNDCLSGICTDQKCAQSGPAGACRVDGDCTSGTCHADSTCAAGTAGGVGTACTQASDCLSNTCTNNVCDSGIQETPCNTDTDCSDGLTCSGGSCSEVGLN